MKKKIWVKILIAFLCVYALGVIIGDNEEIFFEPVGPKTVETTAEVETNVPIEEPEVVLGFLDDLDYSIEKTEAMRTVLVNVGITEITELEIGNVSYGMQVVKGLAYKDTSFLADANDEVQVQFNIENGVIYLVSIYCPSYYSANRVPYLLSHFLHGKYFLPCKTFVSGM